MESPHGYDAIWSKAKTYINRSFSSKEEGCSDEAMLWASFSFELLAKAALCKINPLLVALPNDDGLSLLVAAGLPGETSKYKSISAKTLFSRCGRVFKSFDKDYANRIAIQRNSELHSGALPYSRIRNSEEWWSKLWVNAEVLLVSQERTVEDFVGTTPRSREVQQLLDLDKDSKKSRVASLLETATRNVTLEQEIDLPTFWGHEFSTFHECPVCTDRGELLGDNIEDSEVLGYDPDDDTLEEVVTVISETFCCGNCGLLIEGWDYISLTNIPETFSIQRDYEPDYGDMYGND